MNQALTPPNDLLKQIVLRGLTLQERLRIGRKPSGKISRSSLKRVRIWRSWFEKTASLEAWTAFLAEEGLTETKLAAWDDFADANDRLPNWAATLARIFE